ncbi:hypothetical protein ANO11243_078490 [Dothideomycetidae sp. 11243]|nr:hypothetical protein ANO11243_078490 [fungal sp. No.11243]
MQAGRSYAQPRGARGQGHAYAQQTQAQNQAALAMQRQQQEAEARRREREIAHRISRRPADRNIPDEVADVTIGDGVERYKKLRDMERRLDATMMQKRLDLTDPYRQRTEVEGTLRVWISNTAEGQPWQLMEEGGAGLGEDGTFDFADSSQATYRIKIEGRLLEDPLAENKQDQGGDGDGTDQAGTDSQTKPASQRPRFSDFFNMIKIDFDRAPSLQSDGLSTIEWKRPAPDAANKPRRVQNPSEASFDTLEFQRKGDEELNITVNLYREYNPPRYRLSGPLRDLLDISEADLATTIAGIWDYVRAHNLQEDDEHRRFICDDRLRAIFGREILAFPSLRDLLATQGHLDAIPPIQLPYTIRLDKPYISPPSSDPSAPSIYDIRVSLPSPLAAAVRTMTHDPAHLNTLKQIQDLDMSIAELVQALNHSVQKHRFLSNLADDPAGFIRRWLASQKRDLEIVLAEGGRGYGEDGPLPEAAWRGGEKGMWGGEGVREGVGVFLARARAR